MCSAASTAARLKPISRRHRTISNGTRSFRVGVDGTRHGGASAAISTPWQRPHGTPQQPLPLTSAFAWRWSGSPGATRTPDQRFRNSLALRATTSRQSLSVMLGVQKLRNVTSLDSFWTVVWTVANSPPAPSVSRLGPSCSAPGITKSEACGSSRVDRPKDLRIDRPSSLTVECVL